MTTHENVWFANENKKAFSELSNGELGKVEPFLNLIEINKDGNVLLGSNQLGGANWRGSLWLFQNPDDCPDPRRSIAGIEMEVGVSDAKFMPNGSHFVAADYSCDLSLVEVARAAPDCPVILSRSTEFKGHDNYVTTIAIGSSEDSFVTGGDDLRIIIWDVEAQGSRKIYTSGHTSVINQIVMKPEQGTIFASASQDGVCTLWDSRLDRPASQVFRNNAGYSSLDWFDDNTVITGSLSGSVDVIDVRSRSAVCSSLLSASKAVRRLRVSRESQLVAVAVNESPRVRVLSYRNSSLSNVFQSSSHVDTVCGLFWSTQTLLHSCGWDGQVCHEVISEIPIGTN